MRNDSRTGKEGPRRGPPPHARGGVSKDEAANWLWGWHAVEAALRNPERPTPERLVCTAERARAIGAFRPDLKPELADPPEIARRLPQGAVHQGIALRTPPLEGVSLEDVGEPASGVILVLDQVTDPQNVGAMLRSAAAFGARGVVMQDRHAPLLGGALAKAAAGALERAPVVRAVNLSRALERLNDLGWTSIGLDGQAQTELSTIVNIPATVIVLGSEGEGLRRLVSEHCDHLAKISMPGGFESLNVASAAAIALYAATQGLAPPPTGE